MLRDVSFDVGEGEVVAVVGRTGSGKSSLGRVLTQFYTGYRGNVELDVAGTGHELSGMVPGHVRQHLLMVQQDVFLFQDDVAYNVSLGEEHIASDPQRPNRRVRRNEQNRQRDRHHRHEKARKLFLMLPGEVFKLLERQAGRFPQRNIQLLVAQHAIGPTCK